MVAGLDKFREYFKGLETQYAVIGGSACFLILEDAGLDFRATKDIDMVLCVEVPERAFTEQFKAFLDEGKYQARERSDGRREFYRFHDPASPGFPYMIEIFSRRPGTLFVPESDDLATVTVENDAISLSAILLDEDYFQALKDRKRVVDGITIIDEELLIPFKARAFLDLSRRRKEGEPVRGDDIRKHRRDVFRLAQLIREGQTIDLSRAIKEDLRKFLDLVEEEGTLDPSTFGVPISLEDSLTLLRKVYQIN